MKQKIGHFSKKVIDLLNLDIEPGTPIYMSDSNVQHMKTSHPGDYARYFNNIESILDHPDYVGKNPSDGSIEFVKEYKIDGDYVKVAVRISSGGLFYARSLYVLNSNRTFNFIAKGTLKKV